MKHFLTISIVAVAFYVLVVTLSAKVSVNAIDNSGYGYTTSDDNVAMVYQSLSDDVIFPTKLPETGVR